MRKQYILRLASSPVLSFASVSAFAEMRLRGLRCRWEDVKSRLFDWRYGTHTYGDMPLIEAGISEEKAKSGNNLYRPFWNKEFCKAISNLPIHFPDYAFVDVGSGKGKLLLLAARFPFSKVIGIEYAPLLHEIAVENISKWNSRAGQQTELCSINIDATEWELPHIPAVYFLNNPFDYPTLNRFFLLLETHVSKNKIPTIVIYGNLRHVNEREEAFRLLTSFSVRVRKQRYVVYQSQ
jgi:hypothetical protein